MHGYVFINLSKRAQNMNGIDGLGQRGVQDMTLKSESIIIMLKWIGQ